MSTRVFIIAVSIVVLCILVAFLPGPEGGGTQPVVTPTRLTFERTITVTFGFRLVPTEPSPPRKEGDATNKDH